jgi:hypothetical protein
MLDNVSERTGIGRQVQQQRQPGLQIVVIAPGGEQQVVCGPPQTAPLIEATATPVAVPVPGGGEDF